MFRHFRLVGPLLSFGRLATYTRPVQARARHYLPTMTSGKIESPHFTALLTPDLLRVEKVFKSAGYGFRLVGGVVRDLLLGQAPKDIDVCTECTPEEMVKLLERARIRCIPTGMSHGTITVVVGEFTCEITTLRVDQVTDGRHAVVQFVSDWKEDALRRDLTINAMSLSLDGTLYDYFDGEKHLMERRILFVGDPWSRIREDYLRILRYFRFYGRIAPSEGHHDEDTVRAIRELAEGLRRVSAERVWSEMSRILVGRQAPGLLRKIYELGVAEHIQLPSDGDLTEFERVWEAMSRRQQERRLPQLLRPESLLSTLTHTGEQFSDLADSWRLSRRQKQTGIFIATHRGVAYDRETPLKHFQDMLVQKNPSDYVLEMLRYCDRVDYVVELEKWPIPAMPVNGDDLIKAGVAPDRKMGLILRALQKIWMEGGYTLSKDELMGKVEEVGVAVGGVSGKEGEGMDMEEGVKGEAGEVKRRKVELNSC